MNLRAALVAAMAAAGFSTVVQVALWIALTDAFPAVLERDARLAAAIVLGPQVLRGGSALAMWAVASIVHVVLSVVYALVLAFAIERVGRRASVLLGAAFGVALYVVNLYGFTTLYPWFVVARDAITLAAHVAFGVSAGVAYDRLARGNARQGPVRPGLRGRSR